MKSYPHEMPSPQPGYAVRQLMMDEILTGQCGDDVACRQQAMRYLENPYKGQLFRHLVGTALLAAITVLAWLSLIGLSL